MTTQKTTNEQVPYELTTVERKHLYIKKIIN
jgi:hypothetical protein